MQFSTVSTGFSTRFAENLKNTREKVRFLRENLVENTGENVEKGFFWGKPVETAPTPTRQKENPYDQKTEKGAVLNARILWTFSAAYRLLKKEEYLSAAMRAKRYVIDHFYDREFGGIYWSLDYKGHPLDTKKQIYAIGFAIYGLSEYHRATGDTEALEYAVRLFEDIEKYSFDSVKNGYCEALAREWGEIADMRLSDKDENERKTMNTHLHILEPYTNL